MKLSNEQIYQIRNGISVIFLISATIYIYGVLLFEYRLITEGQVTFYVDKLSTLEFYTLIPATILFLGYNLSIKSLRFTKWFISEYQKWLKRGDNK